MNPDKAFLDEDGEILSISDAGSIDEIDSDHEQPSEMEHPMRQMAASAMSSLNEGKGCGQPSLLCVHTRVCSIHRGACIHAGHHG